MDERELKRKNESAEEDVKNDDVPKPKKPTFESTTRESASDEKRDDDYSAAGGSSTSQEVCFMEQLPAEILETIFTHVARDSFRWKYKKGMQVMDLRLVCRTWHNILSQNGKVYFSKTVPHAHLENCGFERISLQLRDVDLNELPLSTWEKIGCKLNSLVLDRCKIGDQCLKNIIIHCCSLQSLKVVLKDNDDNADLFCSPDMLRELHITRKNLENFEIINTQKTVDVTKWIQIFEVFFKVFPHVTHFTSACSNDPKVEETFRFEFSKELDEGDASGIASSLAFSLSTNASHHRQALDTSSTLRLINVSMRFMKRHYNDEDEITLIKFFTNHRNLQCIKIEMKESISSDTLKTLLFKILEHCSNLRKLQYCKVIPKDWLNTLPKTEFLQLRTMCSHLEELSLNFLKFLISNSSLSCIYDDRSCSNMSFDLLWEQRVLGFVMTYPDLQHLDIECLPCTDDTLQKIYQHLITLKTLSIRVTYDSTNLGITGRRGDVSGVCKRRAITNSKIRSMFSPMGSLCNSNSSNWISGYSINRLKNLEELTIIGYSFSVMNDTIFYEFDFPKLRYLLVDSPDDPTKLLPIMGQNLPSIEKIYFMSQISDYECPEYFENSEKSLVSFCRQTKKLREIILRKTSLGDGMSKSEIIDVFNVCPSLRLIEGCNKVAYYDPITQKVVAPVEEELVSDSDKESAESDSHKESAESDSDKESAESDSE